VHQGNSNNSNQRQISEVEVVAEKKRKKNLIMRLQRKQH
jgi:hypothetical protein